MLEELLFHDNRTCDGRGNLCESRGNYNFDKSRQWITSKIVFKGTNKKKITATKQQTNKPN